MKKTLLLLFVFFLMENINAQDLTNLDSIVIRLNVRNETEWWSYNFAFSEKSILVHGKDLCACCHDKYKGIYYFETTYRKYILYDEDIINPKTKKYYLNEIAQKAKDIFALNNLTEDSEEEEPTYFTIWHFYLYKNGCVIKYYYFDKYSVPEYDKYFNDIFIILYQIKKHKCL